MLLLLLGCLGANLNGDSVFPAQPEPSSDSASLSMITYEASTETSGDIESTLGVELSSGDILVVHNGVSLSCDMSQYESTLTIDETSIEVMYMPLEDQRDCTYNISFHIYHELVGTYALRVMEDEHSVDLE